MKGGKEKNMAKKTEMNNAYIVNRVLLGLLMLVPGLLKLFVSKPSGVTGMLVGLGFPAAGFFAWILIIFEILSGVAILANYKMRYAVWPPMIILLVAALTAAWGSWPAFIMHLVAISNYWIWGMHKN